MTGNADIRIDRLVLEGFTLTQSEASRLGRLIAIALGSGPLPTERAVDRLTVSATTGAGTRPGAGQASLEQLARQVADDIRRKLA